MRPASLSPLFQEARTLKGVGPRVERLLAKALGAPQPRVLDVAFHLPSAIVDRSYRPAVIAAEPGRVATLKLYVLSHKPSVRGRRMPYRVLCSDDTAAIELVFFTAYEDQIKRALPPGETRVVSGRVESFGGRLQIAHPDYIGLDDLSVPEREAIYRTTDGLAARTLGRITAQAVARIPALPEWQDPHLKARKAWPDFADALRSAHAPRSEADLAITTPARQRLAYDELLANQLALALIRADLRGRPGRGLRGHGRLRARVRAALPFKLTAAQEEALREIEADMAASRRMLRLLQGDVGSGKTVVALMALLAAIEAGAQGAFMAPTELLARQHAATVAPLADAAGVTVAVLTGREKGRAREELLARLKEGEIQLVIGTHALFSADVAFRDLGLAVVDEQHRFGVHQRMQLQGKGGRPADVLVMTATPIPRTLQLTAYGDMDVSRLTGKPAGRRPIDTRLIPAARLEDVIAALRSALKKGARAYWVCPLVDESEKSDLAAAAERAAMLRNALGEGVGLVHGRMKPAERDAAMAAFKGGATRLLVATTVIEVGVDVPEATIMVIEHAERFGLAQLHQLRGRVGRGTARSTCLLVHYPPLSATAKERLAAMRRTDDGFVLAEEDLRLRGAGELLGVKQSGMPEFRFADLAVHTDLIAAARDDARLILHKDPTLSSARGQALRALLYLFQRDEAVRYLRTG